MNAHNEDSAAAPDQDSAAAPDQPVPALYQDSQSLIEDFVTHWGLMARTWGINSSMGELFALLYITGTEWTANDLRVCLSVSRGNVSMNLRELVAWGVVHKVHRPDERRELFRAETDVWTLFRRILSERKRRELDRSLQILDQTVRLAADRPELADLKARVESLLQFFELIDTLAVRLLSMPSADLARNDFPAPEEKT